jgi:hypothetical protein
MPYSTVGKNKMLDYLATVATKASLHSADPGTNGTANELAGGNPAYARKTVSWNAAGSPTPGNINLNGTAVFDVPPAGVVLYVGFWNTGGTEYYGCALMTQETFAGQGTYTLTDADLNLNA